MTDSNSVSNLAWQVQLGRAIAWPLFGVFIVICFWSSLHKTISAIASVVVNSEAITIGQFSIKVGRRTVKPSPEVAAVTKKLSAENLKTLTELASKPNLLYPVRPDPVTKSLNDKLITLDLAKELSPDELAAAAKTFPAGYKFVYGIRIAPLGMEVISYINQLTTEIVAEIIMDSGGGDPSTDK